MCQIIRVTSESAQQTEQVGQALGKQLKGGELIELIGDVGAGKTVFVKGLAQGVGSKDTVTSPTFVLKNVYRGRLELQHLDLYRLDEPGLITHEIMEARSEPKNVVVIEWAGIADAVLPEERITVKFTAEKNEKRILEIDYDTND